jgi:hypothetical protein
MAIAMLVVIATRTARADDDLEPPPPTQTVVQRSPVTAELLSLGGTLGSFALFGIGTRSATLVAASVASLVITPSIGHIYAGEYLTGGLGIRLVGELAVFYGASLSCKYNEEHVCSGPTKEQVGWTLAGAGVLLVGVGFDLVTAPGAAQRYNREHAQVTLVPIATDRSYGLALAGSF